MTKARQLLFVMAFLLVQMGSLMHMAEHGFAEHQHDGQLCDIALFSKIGGAVDTPAVSVLFPGVVVLALIPPLAEFDIALPSAISRPFPRAPPHPTTPT